MEEKSDLQESLLGQALEGGPTIHMTPTNNIQVSKANSLLRMNIYFWRLKFRKIDRCHYGSCYNYFPTVHFTDVHADLIYFQAQSTCDDSNSMSENDDDMSNNDSILNAVKTEPSDMLNEPVDSVHRNNSNHHVIPAALLGLQGDYTLKQIFGWCS